MASQPIEDIQDAPIKNVSGEPANDPAPSLSEVEEIALEKGWLPKEQYKGPETMWKPATDFLRKMPGTRDLKREIQDLKSNMDKIVSVADKQVKREVAERTREIEERFQAAVEAKDAGAAAKAAKDMRELEQETVAPAGEDYEARFTRENPWYGKDDEASAYAVVLANKANAQGKSPEDQLKFAAEGVRKVFPHLFEDAASAPKPPLTLNAPGRNVAAPKTKGYSDMPDTAKRAADRFYEQAKQRNGDKVPDRKAFDAQYAKDFFGA